MLRSFNLYSWDHHRVLRELHADYGVSAFFRVDVVTDWGVAGAGPRAGAGAGQHNIIRVSPAGLGMPDKTFYQRFPNDSSIQVQGYTVAVLRLHEFLIDPPHPHLTRTRLSQINI